MRATPIQRTRNLGFSHLETLLTIILFSVAIVITVELFVAITARTASISRAEGNSRGPQHVLSAFSAALDSATHCAVYPDRFAFEHQPALGGTSGNFAMVWQADGSALAFELALGELRILENPGSTIARERLCARGIEAPQGLCSLQNGALMLKFTAPIGATPTPFTTCARAACAR